MHPGARIDEGAIVARSVVGVGAHVAAGAEVRGSILLPGSSIGAHAVVERAIVGPGATVGERARVDDLAVLGDRAVVDPGLRVSGGSVGVDEPLTLESGGR